VQEAVESTVQTLLDVLTVPTRVAEL
jgi:hypothetical protein